MIGEDVSPGEVARLLPDAVLDKGREAARLAFDEHIRRNRGDFEGASRAAWRAGIRKMLPVYWFEQVDEYGTVRSIGVGRELSRRERG